MKDSEHDLNLENLESQPKGITIKKAFKILMIPASILHLIFSIILFKHEINILAYYNLASFIIYIVLFLIASKKISLSIFIWYIEIMVFTVLCDFYLGTHYGFFLYNACLIPIIYFSSTELNGKLFPAYIRSTAVVVLVIILRFMSVHAPEKQFEQVLIKYREDIYSFNITFVWIFLNILIIAYISEMNFARSILEKKNKILYQSANMDYLTKIPNRRFMKESLKQITSEFEINQDPFTILIGDIDNFKSFNDNYGHDIGDIVLQTVSNILKKYSKENNQISVARWGGEEFLIVIKKSSIENAKAIGENILKDIRSCEIPYQEKSLKITMTFGGAIYKEKSQSFEDIIKQADINLYEGKTKTKDCIVI